MEFTIQTQLKDNIYNIMRDLSYHFWGQNGRTGELVFTHPIRGDAFPRFHIFLTIRNDKFIFDLHLDQKGPIYKGVAAHQGEYSGELVEKEAERIKRLFKK